MTRRVMSYRYSGMTDQHYGRYSGLKSDVWYCPFVIHRDKNMPLEPQVYCIVMLTWQSRQCTRVSLVWCVHSVSLRYHALHSFPVQYVAVHCVTLHYVTQYRHFIVFFGIQINSLQLLFRFRPRLIFLVKLVFSLQRYNALHCFTFGLRCIPIASRESVNISTFLWNS